ncbi:hypothetical protein OUZ56_022106 [Daphnia magna]|uniref:Uncharacterized protein n=1 Tax=Daphnia magna TaxID=35525 RepID=A0ABR0AVE5_9CRUS|nr:hypothetical protein OUZ56_022106 [Daphnia magna]
MAVCNVASLKFLRTVINDRHDQVVPRTSQTTTTKKRRNQNGIEAKLAIVLKLIQRLFLFWK